MQGRDTWHAWTLAESLQRRVHPRWREWKELGNVALKNGERMQACYCYTQALVLAQPCLALDILVRGALAGDAEPAIANVIQIADVLRMLRGYLENGLGKVSVRPCGIEESIVVTVPNLPAAICLSNRSHAQLLSGNLEAACFDAELAAELCPEYIKGHKRCEEIYRKMGRDSDLQDKRKQVRVYEENAQHLPFYATALLSAGFISDEDLLLVYLGPWKQQCLKRIAEACGLQGRERDPTVCVMLSLVNFLDGQWLMCSVNYLDDAWVQHKIDCIDFHCVDLDNGPDLDLPPHGHASESAVEHVQEVIKHFLIDLKDNGITAGSIMLGQGLTDSTDLVHPIASELFERILIYPAFATGASMAAMERVHWSS